MRELKFRVWGITEKEYIRYPFAWLSIFDSPDGLEIEDNEDLVIEQYTGLKDKNGKDIYEGDIVLVANHGRTPFVVAYREGDCSFVVSNEAMMDYVHMFKDMPQCYEVIGNIHENPELLERRKNERPSRLR